MPRAFAPFPAEKAYVVGDGDSGEPLGEDPPPPRVGLALGDDSHPCPLEPEVQSPDP